MSDDWKITGSRKPFLGNVASAFHGQGGQLTRHTVKNESTGEVRKVDTYDGDSNYGVGDAISSGTFIDLDLP